VRTKSRRAEVLIRGYVEVAARKKSGSEVRTKVGAGRRLGVLWSRGRSNLTGLWHLL
jgi:hypothetical protein